MKILNQLQFYTHKLNQYDRHLNRYFFVGYPKLQKQKWIRWSKKGWNIYVCSYFYKCFPLLLVNKKDIQTFPITWAINEWQIYGGFATFKRQIKIRCKMYIRWYSWSPNRVLASHIHHVCNYQRPWTWVDTFHIYCGCLLDRGKSISSYLEKDSLP